MENQNNLERFKEFIEYLDKVLKTNNFKEISKFFPLIERFEQLFLSGYDKRKKEGTFYTSKSISDFIVNEVLLCLIDKNINKDTQNIKLIQNLDNILKSNQDNKQEIIDLLLNSTICDPACGSGGFLLSAANSIYNTIIKLNCQLPDIQIKKHILSNLYGFDINEYPIKLCILRLLRWFNYENKSELEEIISTLKSNLKIQNSIINAKFPHFDIIVGNPPYGNILNQKEKEFLKKESIFFKDIYCTFLIKALEWSNQVIGFLVPKSFLLRQSYIRFRNNFLSKANILKIFDIGSKIFKRATNEVQIIIYEKNEFPERDLTIYDYPNMKIITYPKQTVDSLRICFNLECPLCLKSKKLYAYTYKNICPYCKTNTTKLNRIRIKPTKQILDLIEKIETKGDLNYLNPVDFPKMIRGEEEIGLETVKRNLLKDTSGSCYFISARNDFSYYSFNKNKSFNIEALDPKILKGNEFEYYIKPKLLIKHNNIIPEAIFTNEKVCFTSSIYSLLHKDINELKYLCAILNSILIQFYCIYAINNQKDTTINLNQYMIRHLPIIKLNDEIKNKIVSKVEIIDLLLLKNRKTTSDKYYQELREIDDTFFKLYSITSKEANLIISKTKNQIKHFESIYK
ncbi:MAG: Eco57I restriction-modification methylase domain-containing protein [Promethearchaeota archaeon]